MMWQLWSGYAALPSRLPKRAISLSTPGQPLCSAVEPHRLFQLIHLKQRWAVEVIGTYRENRPREEEAQARSGRWLARGRMFHRPREQHCQQTHRRHSPQTSLHE